MEKATNSSTPYKTTRLIARSRCSTPRMIAGSTTAMTVGMTPPLKPFRGLRHTTTVAPYDEISTTSIGQLLNIFVVQFRSYLIKGLCDFAQFWNGRLQSAGEDPGAA